MSDQAAPHIPVLIHSILDAVAPVSGTWIDGTFGAGGYSRAFLDAGAEHVIGIDRDPEVFDRAAAWKDDYAGRLTLVAGEFGLMDELISEQVDGVVLDIGVSSMQLDQPERGFSFMSDGPLDMRMAQAGMTAADIVNRTEEKGLADILFLYGEERASRRIAKAIIAARKVKPIETTLELVDIIERALPRPKPGQAHPATRSFQALRIAVNDELGQLVKGLQAAERLLAPGGFLAVVTFHSLEDRIVKRFMAEASGDVPGANRYAPEAERPTPRFERVSRKAIAPRDDEIQANPRARSAKLRVARRLAAPAGDIDPVKLGLPKFDLGDVI